MPKIYFISEFAAFKPAQAAESFPPSLALWLDAEGDFLSLARQYQCENGGKGHFVLQVQVNNQQAKLPIQLAAGSQTGYPFFIMDNQAAQQMVDQFVQGISQSGNASLQQPIQNLAQAFSGQEFGFFMQLLQSGLQDPNNSLNRLQVQWLSPQGQVLAQTEIMFGPGASAQVVQLEEGAASSAPSTAAPQGTIQLSNSQGQTLSDGSTFSDFLLLHLQSPKNMSELARSQNSEAMGEAHFILECEVNGTGLAIPLRYGSPAKQFLHLAYPVFSLDDQLATGLQQAAARAGQSDAGKALQFAAQQWHRQEHQVLQQHLLDNLQEGDNHLVWRWSGRDLSRPAEAKAQNQAIAELSLQLRYELPAHLKSLLSPQQIAEMEAQADALYAQEQDLAAHEIYEAILAGLDKEERYDTPHRRIREKAYQSKNRHENRIAQAQRQAAEAQAEAERRQREAEKAKADAEAKAAEEAHILANLYYIEPVADEGVQGEVHAKYLNQIVFSKTPIDKQPQNDTAFCQNFQADEDIYGRIFLPKSIQNYFNAIGNPHVYNRLFIRYQIQAQGNSYLAERNLNFSCDTEHWNQVTSLAFSPSPAAQFFQVDESFRFPEIQKNIALNYLRDPFLNLYLLPDGLHEVKIELYMRVPEDENPENLGIRARFWRTEFGPEISLAQGQFQFQINAQTRRQLGLKIKPPVHKSSMLNPELEAVLKQRINQTTIYVREDRQTEPFEIRKIAITSSTWQHERDKVWNHLILYRWARFYFYVYFKESKVLALFTAQAQEDHLGNGNFGETRLSQIDFTSALPLETLD